jgi:CRP/FNR family transcriptional regulator
MVYRPADMGGFEGLKGFRTLAPDERARVAAAAHEYSAGRGTVLFTEGQRAESVWAVKEGLVHIVKFGHDGKEVVLELIPPGELFGAVVALQDRPYPASAVAAEPSVVWRLPAALARDLCQKHPALRASIMEQVATRLREAHERLRSVALEPVEQRLARVLLSLAGKIGKAKGGTTTLAVTRQELADMVGTTVETTIRITSKWQRAGIVSSSRHELGVLDRQMLEAIARGEET